MQHIKLPSVMTPANPIVNAEFHHQRFVIQRGRVGGIWIALAGIMVVPAILISIAYTVAAFVHPLVPSAIDVLNVALGTMTSWIWLGIMLVAMYPVVTLITFALAANSIRREKSNNTWDNLRLTGLTPRQIVVGKWWASLRALNGDHGMLIVMRFGVAAAAVMIYSDMTITPFGVPSAWTILPILLSLTILYGLLDAGLTAALGIAGATVDVGGPIVPFTLFSVRVITAVAALAFWFLTLFVIPSGLLIIFLLTGIGFIGYALVTWLVLVVAQHLVE